MIWQASEWKASIGWMCTCTDALDRSSGNWMHDVAIFNTTPIEFIKMLIKDYKVSTLSFNRENNMLVFAWDSQINMRKYKNEINKRARKAQYTI